MPKRPTASEARFLQVPSPKLHMRQLSNLAENRIEPNKWVRFWSGLSTFLAAR